jgi:hypothetical protein
MYGNSISLPVTYPVRNHTNMPKRIAAVFGSEGNINDYNATT